LTSFHPDPQAQWSGRTSDNVTEDAQTKRFYSCGRKFRIREDPVSVQEIWREEADEISVQWKK